MFQDRAVDFEEAATLHQAHRREPRDNYNNKTNHLLLFLKSQARTTNCPLHLTD